MLGGLEVSVLVEDIVSGQKALVPRFLDFTIEADGGGMALLW